MTPTPSQDPPIPQGGGGLMGYDHDHGRGGGGGTRNLEHIYIYIILFKWWTKILSKPLHRWGVFLVTTFPRWINDEFWRPQQLRTWRHLCQNGHNGVIGKIPGGCFNDTQRKKRTWGFEKKTRPTPINQYSWLENGPGLKTYSLLNMGIFHCYVSSPVGTLYIIKNINDAPYIIYSTVYNV